MGIDVKWPEPSPLEDWWSTVMANSPDQSADNTSPGRSGDATAAADTRGS
jgi:hypothetical protein